jgi:hypothetical protein
MGDFREDGQDQFGFDVNDGLGFTFNHSGVREFIRADEMGVVTHRLFIYQNGESPRVIEQMERDTIAGNLPRFSQAWMRHDAPERRGNPPAVSSARVPELLRGAGGDRRGGDGGGAGGDRRGGGGSGGAGGGRSVGFRLPEFRPEYGGRRTRKNKNRK